MTLELRVMDVRVPMRDGTMLAADVSLAVDGPPGPVLLMRTPYGRSGGRTSDDLVGASRLGWAFVVQDVRGTGDSEGDFRPYQQEITDGDDTLRWIADQPWCDGRVAMVGGSYVGATQWLAAMSGNGTLKGIAPMVTGSGFREGWTYEGGAFAHGFVTPWARLFAVLDPGTSELLREAGMDVDLAPLLSVAPVVHPLAQAWPPYRDWLCHDDDASWDRIDIAASHPCLDTPAFHVGGWYDGFVEGTIGNYTGMRRHARTPRTRVLQRLLIGPWTHAQVGARVQGDLDFGAGAAVSPHELQLEALAWLRRVLDGAEDGLPRDARVFIMGRNEWVDLPLWPPTSDELRLHLSVGSHPGEGTLMTAEPEIEGMQALTYDPLDPVPTWGGRGIDFGLPSSGPREQFRIERRNDVLAFTSAPLDHDLTVMGAVDARISLTSEAASVDLVARLCDVQPDGRSFNVLDGIRRTATSPGSERVVHVPLGSTAMTFRAGNRIRLQVCSSNFPRFDLNACVGGHRSVRTGPTARSTLSLATVALPATLASTASQARRQP